MAEIKMCKECQLLPCLKSGVVKGRQQYQIKIAQYAAEVN